MQFDENVGGLNRGAPVLFKGIPVGQVLEVTLEFDSPNRTFQIPVLVAMEPERFKSNAAHTQGADFRKLLDYFVQKRDASPTGDRQLPHRPAGDHA